MKVIIILLLHRITEIGQMKTSPNFQIRVITDSGDLLGSTMRISYTLKSLQLTLKEEMLHIEKRSTLVVKSTHRSGCCSNNTWLV